MRQAAIEPTCFAYLALRSDPLYAQHLDPDALLKMQLDGSWPVIPGDGESSWATTPGRQRSRFLREGSRSPI